MGPPWRTDELGAHISQNEVWSVSVKRTDASMSHVFGYMLTKRPTINIDAHFCSPFCCSQCQPSLYKRGKEKSLAEDCLRP